MAISCNSAGTGRGVNHGSGASLDDLMAANCVGWVWLNRRAAGNNQYILSKDQSGPNGWGLLSSTNGNLRLIAFGTGNADYTSADNVLVQDVDTFAAFVWTTATRSAKLYIGTRTTPPAEVSYTVQTAGTGTLVADAAASLYVGNLQRSTTLPFLGDIQSGGIIAATGTPALILALWYSSVATNAARTGCKLSFDYTSNATLTDGSGNSNNGTLLGSAPTGTTITPPAVTKKAVTDTSLFFSPYNWYSDGGGALASNNVNGSSTYAQSNNVGAYLKTKVTVGAGGLIFLELDTAHLSTLTASKCPTVLYRVGRAGSGTQLTASTTASVSLGSGLAAGTYEVEVWHKSIDLNSPGDEWTTPAQSVKVLGLIIDSDGSLVAPTVRTKRAIFYGDSNFQGADLLGTDLLQASNDATQAPPAIVGNGLNTEWGAIAFGGQGWTRGIGNVVASSSAPALYSSTAANRSFDQYANGKTRDISGVDYAVLQFGPNDSSLTAQQVTDALDAIRTAAGSSTWIFVEAGPSASDAVWTTVTSGVAAVAAPTRTQLLPVTRTITAASAGQYTSDGGSGSQHLNSRGTARLSGDLLALILGYIGTGGGGLISTLHAGLEIVGA